MFHPDTWVNSAFDITKAWKLAAFWPPVPTPKIPDHLPDSVGRALLQAERNFQIEGNEEAAGTMYRKALDMGLKVINPELKGTLEKRIDALAEAGTLTTSLKDWAHQIRSLGNESAHDEEPPTREELTALRNFSDLVMQYLFTLPRMVELAKSADKVGDS